MCKSLFHENTVVVITIKIFFCSDAILFIHLTPNLTTRFYVNNKTGLFTQLSQLTRGKKMIISTTLDYLLTRCRGCINNSWSFVFLKVGSIVNLLSPRNKGISTYIFLHCPNTNHHRSTRLYNFENFLHTS